MSHNQKKFHLHHLLQGKISHSALKTLIKNNLNRIEEILWGNVIVSLSHYKNTNRRLPIKGETNGSHFKLPEEVFNLVTNFDNKDEDEPPKPEYKTVINI